mgnify:CR=1 FL=1
MQGLTGLPQAFLLVTREIVDIAHLLPGQLPACLLQMEGPPPEPKLSHIIETRLPGRVVVLFPVVQGELPATWANQYRVAIEQALTGDLHRGGLIDGTQLEESPVAALWPETNLLSVTIRFSCLYEYDPRLPAVA